MISPLLLFLYFILIIILTVFLHHIIQQSKSKKVKELLAESHNLISVSKDILCILSPNWFILQVNPSFEKILSYDRMEIINQNFSIILSPDEKDNFLTIRKSLASQERLKFTTKLISKEGEEKWISWYAFFDKHSLKIYAAGRDITNENLFYNNYNSLKREQESSSKHTHSHLYMEATRQ